MLCSRGLITLDLDYKTQVTPAQTFDFFDREMKSGEELLLTTPPYNPLGLYLVGGVTYNPPGL